MSFNRKRGQSERIRGALGLGLAGLLLGWPGWLGWSMARTGMLGREVSGAVRVTDWGRAQAALERVTWDRPNEQELIRIRVEIALRWPSRRTEVWTNVPASTSIELMEGKAPTLRESSAESR
jgi:hypothetical protein